MVGSFPAGKDPSILQCLPLPGEGSSWRWVAVRVTKGSELWAQRVGARSAINTGLRNLDFNPKAAESIQRFWKGRNFFLFIAD